MLLVGRRCYKRTHAHFATDAHEWGEEKSCYYRTFRLPCLPQTVCDYVVATTIITWDGKRVELSRVDDPEGFALKIAHFGLLGVTLGERTKRCCFFTVAEGA